MTTGWAVGFAVGTVVVVVVVVLLLLLIVHARRISSTAEQILAALRTSRDHTVGLWEFDETNALIDRIGHAAAAARETLEQQANPSRTGP